jgi:hypothetical protein
LLIGFTLTDVFIKLQKVGHSIEILENSPRKLLSGAKLVIFLHIYKEKGRKFFDNLHFVKSGVKFPVSFEKKECNGTHSEREETN